MNQETETPRLDAIVLPSSLDLRSEAQAVLDATTLIDFAEAIRTGNRIASFTPFADWLAESPNGKLHLRQMVETILWELRERDAKQELRQIMLTALGYIID